MVRRCAYFSSDDDWRRHGKDETGPESENGARCGAVQKNRFHVATIAIAVAGRNKVSLLSEQWERHVRFFSDVLLTYGAG
jgi:hypothetical protein